MADALKLRILTPEREIVNTTVSEIHATSVEGDFGILPNHTPLVTPLSVGLLSYKASGKQETAAVMGGMLYTDGKTATVLTDAAELGSDIDEVRAQQAKARAEARLKEKTDLVDLNRAELAMARALTRLKASRRSH